jgi:1,4-alpha-glucan branching enzyme
MVKKRKSEKLESKMEELKKVNFTLLAPDAQNVSLAGDFNDWNANSHLLQKVSNGMWEINIDLNPGRYEYRFLVDGEWKNDPNCMSIIPNSFGSENCMLKL